MPLSVGLRAKLLRLCVCLALLPLEPALLFSQGDQQVCALHGAQCSCLDHCVRQGVIHHKGQQEEASRPSCHRDSAPRQGTHAAHSSATLLPEGPVWTQCGRRTLHAVGTHETPGVMAATLPPTTVTSENLDLIPRQLPLPLRDGPAPPPPRA